MPNDLWPDSRDLYWGEFHKHVSGPGADIDRIDEVIGHARSHLDVLAVLCYPYTKYRAGRGMGTRVDTVRQRPPMGEWWERTQRASTRHNEPGEFVTFPAYEWHADPPSFADHNVIYREEGAPMDGTPTLPQLYEHLQEREAFAIPHHTAYQVGNRGKNWRVFDSELSPVMEVYSGHGSSEGLSTPVDPAGNTSMGPATSGGSLIEGLERGKQVGVIASNDGAGVPGSPWDGGVAGVWAEDLTREAVWKAIQQRRTYGISGDRIRLWWELNGKPMGAVVRDPDADPTATVAVDCPQPLDRIEIIHGGRVVDTYSHHTEPGTDPDDRYRLLVEFGWGPTTNYADFDDTTLDWNGSLRIDGGEMVTAVPRFTGEGQRYEVAENRCDFNLRTSRDDHRFGSTQGLVLDVSATGDANLVIELDGKELIVPFEGVRDQSHLFPFVQESVDRFETEIDVTADDVEYARQLFFNNARKISLDAARPRAACVAEVTFNDLPTAGDYYYVRAVQENGQYAWASPIWYER